MMQVGFEAEESDEALKEKDGDVEKAIAYLITKKGVGQEDK